jgi:hypothetical protein
VPTPVAKHFLLGSIGALLGATFVKLSITRKVYQAVLGGQFSFMAGLVAGRELDALTENMGMKAKVASRSWLLVAVCWSLASGPADLHARHIVSLISLTGGWLRQRGKA